MGWPNLSRVAGRILAWIGRRCVFCNPRQIDSAVQGGFPVHGDCLVVSSEEIDQVVGVFLASVLYGEVVNDQREHDWARGVQPESWGVAALKVAMFSNASGQELIGEDTSLG
jgi:hypothetical protein